MGRADRRDRSAWQGCASGSSVGKTIRPHEQTRLLTEVLGIGRDADETAIKSAYRKLARQYHPDVNKAPDAEERFKEVNEAYEVLSDTDKRQAYDRFGHAAAQGGFGAGGPGAGFGGMGGFGDIFEDFFGGFGGMRGAPRGPARGDDLRYDMEITFQEAVFGAEKEIEIPRLETCPQSARAAAPSRAPSRSAARSAMARARCAGHSRRSWASSSASPRARAATASARSPRRPARIAAGRSASRDPAAVGLDPGRGGRRHADSPGGRGRAGRSQRPGGQPVRLLACQVASAVPAPGERYPAGASDQHDPGNVGLRSRMCRPWMARRS